MQRKMVLPIRKGKHRRCFFNVVTTFSRLPFNLKRSVSKCSVKDWRRPTGMLWQRVGQHKKFFHPTAFKAKRTRKMVEKMSCFGENRSTLGVQIYGILEPRSSTPKNVKKCWLFLFFAFSTSDPVQIFFPHHNRSFVVQPLGPQAGPQGEVLN